MEMTQAPGAGAARHVLVMVSATVIVAVLNYALNIVLGWALPAAEYGRVGVSQTVIFVCVWFLGAGFPWVVSRAIAQARGAGPLDSPEGTLAWRTYKTAWPANTLLTLLVVGLLLLAFSAGRLPLEPSYGPLMIVVAAIVTALGIGAVPDSGLQGLFRFNRIAGVRVTEAATNLVISVVLVVLGMGAVGALGGFAVAAWLACGLNIWFMRDKAFWKAKGWGGLSTMRLALPMTLAVFGGVLLTNLDLLAVKFLTAQGGSDALSGAYQVAAVLARAPYFVGSALISTFYPRIAQEAGVPGSRVSGRKLLNWLGLIVLPMNTIMIAGSSAVVLFFFPPRYASIAPTLAVLSAGSGLLVLALGLAAVLQASGRTKWPALIMSLGVAAQLAGLVWLVPAMGTVGAAIATATASGLSLLLLGVAGRGLGTGLPHIARQVVALLFLGLMVLPLGLFFAGGNRLLVGLWIAAAAILYMVACLLLNLLDAAELKGAVHLRSGRIAGATHALLSAAGALNRLGARWMPTHSGRNSGL